MGTGAARLNLTAGGNIIMAGVTAGEWSDQPFSEEWEFDFGHEFGGKAAVFAQQVASQIEIQVESIARQLDEKLADLGGSEEIAARVQQKVQAAMNQAERKISEAMQRAERHMQEAERRSQRAEERQQRRSARQEARPPRP
ncbi:MAG: hypothetical protein HC802_19290, partial [Caldilineaceae bacterium]|nr:hypothetical protein [Caldilineaceae bacterium]